MPKILVVDDDDALRDVTRQALEASGYEVIEAENGEKGVDLAGSHLPDLILCDVRMEKMDGYSALAALRQNSNTASLPFILMTGQADAAGMRYGMELGADDYLSKPFTIAQLVGAVDARLKKQQTVRSHAERRLTELRANISLALPHELLTPLNGILGFADILIADHATLAKEDIEPMATAIRDSAKRLHRLIENFLIFVQLQLVSEKPSEEMARLEPVSLQPVITAVLSDLDRINDRRPDLVVETEDLRSRIEEEHFRKIVDELLDNAIKFSTPGTPIHLALQRRDSNCVLTVSDQGRGMKPEHIAEIGAYMQFERRFYEQQGSGLGLTIVKGLVERHGGALTVSSETGRGTTVKVSLPFV